MGSPKPVPNTPRTATVPEQRVRALSEEAAQLIREAVSR